MRKNKLYVFLSILTIIFLFSAAAICTECGASIDKAIGGLGDNVDEELPGTEPGGKQPSGTEPGETPPGDEPEPEPEPETEEPEPEEEAEETEGDETSIDLIEEISGAVWETSIAASEEISGWLTEDGFMETSSHAQIGFVNYMDNDFQVKGYLSFDIRELHGKTVQDAEINFISIGRCGNPELFATAILVDVYNYIRLDESDFAGGGVRLASIPINDTSYTIRGETLKTELQKVLDNNIRDYFQIMLSPNATTNSDTLSAYIKIYWNEAVLYISYTD